MSSWGRRGDSYFVFHPSQTKLSAVFFLYIGFVKLPTEGENNTLLDDYR